MGIPVPPEDRNCGILRSVAPVTSGEFRVTMTVTGKTGERVNGQGSRETAREFGRKVGEKTFPQTRIICQEARRTAPDFGDYTT